MADSQSPTYRVTFQGAEGGRPKYTHAIDPKTGARFPLGEAVSDVSQAAVKRLQSRSRLKFTVTEQTPKEQE